MKHDETEYFSICFPGIPEFFDDFARRFLVNSDVPACSSDLLTSHGPRWLPASGLRMLLCLPAGIETNNGNVYLIM